MPCGNPRWLFAAASSVLTQTMSDLELLVVADGVDLSAELVPLGHDHRLRTLTLPERSGVAVARSSAIEAAQGRWIAFCDADDWWAPDKLEVQLGYPGIEHVVMLAAGYQRVDRCGKRFGPPCVPPPRLSYSDFVRGANPVGNSTVLYQASLIGKVYPRPELRSKVDLALWLDLLRPGGACLAVPEVLAYHRLHPWSLTANKARAARAQLALLRSEGLSVPATAGAMTRYGLASVSMRTRARLAAMRMIASVGSTIFGVSRSSMRMSRGPGAGGPDQVRRAGR